MKRWTHGGRRRRISACLARAALLAGVMAAAPACLFVPRAKVLVESFNGGLIDSDRDPSRTREQVARELTAEVVMSAVADGYFGQGDPHARRVPHEVASWVAEAREHAAELADRVVDLKARVDRTDEDTGDHKAPNPWETQVDTKETLDLSDLFAKWIPEAPALPGAQLCVDVPSVQDAPPPLPRLDLAAYHLDRIRFTAGLERAVRQIAELYEERLVDRDTIRQGFELGLGEVEAYLRARHWTRRLERPVTGIVVKGGASTGFYSAGVTWVALNLIDHCLRDAKCRKYSGDPRLNLLSGTSTGATVVAVVDLFNTEWDAVPEGKVAPSPSRALQLLATWYTHLGSGDLYCVRNRLVTDLIVKQQGLVEFNGARSLLRQHLNDRTKNNMSELILNAVDFQSGRLLSISDQDPSMVRTSTDVVAAVEASFVLPFIAKPVPRLIVHGHMVPGTYLDGGIRSEIPLMPLARRGAERALVVSSSSSITGGSKPLQNAAEIAARYIDVSTGGIMESELSHARRVAEIVRNDEIDTCMQDAALNAIFSSQELHKRAPFCQGRWSKVCVASEEGEDSVQGGKSHALWQVMGIFRDEWETDAVSGYDFDPAKVTPLFFAGMDAARLRCKELARFLGVVAGAGKAADAKLAAWCSELPTYLPERSSDEGKEVQSCEDTP